MTETPGSDVAVSTSTAVGPVSDSATGLEDFDLATDSVMPRLKIVGKEAVFQDNLTNEKFETCRAILLGLVKQRILWSPEQDDKGPLCRSNNNTIGLPFVKEFPWRESGFPEPARGTENVELECNNCALKEWGSNPKNTTPWCSEQHTYPLLLETKVNDESAWLPAILTLQRSGLKASKAYTTSFSRTKTPLYTVVTELSLQPQKQGSVDYAVPVIVKKETTDPAKHPEYAEYYRNIRSYLQSPRGMADAEASEGDAKPAAATASAKPPVADDDDPPF
jgi:hypothetical protein